MVATFLRVAVTLGVAATAMVAAPGPDDFISPFFMPDITNTDCGEDVDYDECEQRAEVCSGFFPNPDNEATNATDSPSLDFQDCLIATQASLPSTDPSFTSTMSADAIPVPVPEMVPLRFCALNVTKLLNPDLTINHTGVAEFLQSVVPPDMPADVVVSAVSVCPHPILHSLTAFMHCLRAACLVLTTSDMMPPKPAPRLVLSPYFGAP